MSVSIVNKMCGFPYSLQKYSRMFEVSRASYVTILGSYQHLPNFFAVKVEE